MVEKGDKKLSIARQAELLDINRTSLYYRPVPISREELDIKLLIDEIYTKHPEYGYRKMTKVLRNKHNIIINCKRTRRYMREMGFMDFVRPNLVNGCTKISYPYLLRGLNIDHANQVWSVDIYAG